VQRKEDVPVSCVPRKGICASSMRADKEDLCCFSSVRAEEGICACSVRAEEEDLCVEHVYN
jgi:hypothetical protein